MQRLVEMGYRSDMIEDAGDYFAVEGDILIGKESLRSLPSSRAPRGQPGGPDLRFQYHTNNLVDPAIVTNIRVDVSGAESSWQAAARQAMAEWNALTTGSTIRFVEGSPPHIVLVMSDTMYFGNCTNFVVARAKFPQGGQPGNTVFINSKGTSCLNASQKKYNMAHELGHTIGFRHTNWYTLGEGQGSEGALWIAGTPGTAGDPASVMNGGTGLNSWNGFSYYDKVAGFFLYPPPTFVQPPTYPGGIPSFSWSSAPGSPEYRVRYEVSGYWMDPQHEHWPIWEVRYTPWTFGNSATFPELTYTGVSYCSGELGPGQYYYYAAFFSLEIKYPAGSRAASLGTADVLTCPQ